MEHNQCQKILEQALQDFKTTVVQAGTTQESDKRRLAFLDNKAVCDRARDMMFSALPEYWNSLCKLEDASMFDVISISVVLFSSVPFANSDSAILPALPGWILARVQQERSRW